MTRRILIANVTLAGRTGTEIVTRDLALGLSARGHHVSVYTPRPGEIADELVAAGVRVITRAADIAGPFDLVHGHHHVETLEALAQVPGARGVFVCHDRTAAHSIPPVQVDGLAYVAVDENCLERLRDDWSIPADRTRVILNAVDTSRFRPRPPLPPAPARALIFSHYAAPGTHDEVVKDACARLGISVDVAGAGSGTTSATPETLLPRYDLVFAKARCAIEAMAVGCAVVLCDAGGVGGLVTPADVARLRAWNFGARVLARPLNAETLVGEIRRFDPDEAAAVSRLIREDASLERALDRYEALYEELMAGPGDNGAAVAGVRRLVSPLIARIARLERDLAGFRQPERMPPLSDTDLEHVRILSLQAPSTIAAGASAVARVQLVNGLANQALGSWAPFPLQWGARWRAVESTEFVATTPVRQRLVHPVAAGAREVFAVSLLAPSTPGQYVLRLTLVQEYLRWLDDTGTPLAVEAPVLVTP